MRLSVRFITPLFAVAVVFGSAASRQTSAFQDPQTNGQESDAPDPITRLKLTPEQRQKIRGIREQTKDERAVINQRLKESNSALNEALDAEPLDENLIEQRMREVSTAQAAQMRMRIRTEVMLRRVLNPEQRAMWRTLRLQLRDVIGNQRVEGERPLRPAANGLRPNQRNGIAPLPPRNPKRNPRP
ncbi:MAG TPA: periplasmic heavy metal sensor [Pyrinomonadaceae bacterium]|nr:periplasmic heavy metal sensor [Pyrinomonadaceae bacterium]